MAETIHLTVQSQPPVVMTAEQAQVIRAVSPTATVERIEGGVEVTITDYEQTTTAVIYDGPKGDPGDPGQPGSPGQPGISPTASVTQTATGATVTVTDASGTTTATLTNGPQGPQGPQGPAGADYVLTAQDKEDIAGIVMSELPTWTGGSY